MDNKNLPTQYDFSEPGDFLLSSIDFYTDIKNKNSKPFSIPPYSTTALTAAEAGGTGRGTSFFAMEEKSANAA